MKNNKIKIILLVVLLFLFQTVQVLAERNLPEPTGAGGFQDGVVVGGPIDGYLPMLFFAALIFGAWTITKRKKNLV